MSSAFLPPTVSPNARSRSLSSGTVSLSSVCLLDMRRRDELDRAVEYCERDDDGR